MLPKRFEEPAGFIWGSFTDASGMRIRYGSLQPEGAPRGTIIIAEGFRELIEKYFEVMRDMTGMGFSVWMMDWRGQGGSDRLLKDNPQKMHSDGYDKNIAALHQFMTCVVKNSPGPVVLLAHSMGAHLGLRYMKEHAGIFDSAVLTSPMCNILNPAPVRFGAKLIICLARMFNCLEKYALFGHDWNESEERFSGNNKTSDPERFAVLADIYKSKPALKMGMPTYGWVMHTFDSIDVLNKPDYLKSINAPILMGIAGSDTIVDRGAEVTASGLLPQCTRMDIPEAKHEIWMERDDLRGPWLASVAAFLEARLQKSG